MTSRGALLALIAMLALPAVAHAGGRQYYVSLGDSLAAGSQLTPAGAARLAPGYPRYVLRAARSRYRHLRLRSFGCPGEDTATFRDGPCPYEDLAADPSQLARALDFMRAHRGRIALVTISLGSNDVNRCINVRGSEARRCVADGLRRLHEELPGDLAAIRDAAGRHTQLAALEVYNLYLQHYFDPDRDAPAFLANTTAVVRQINAEIRDASAASGFVTADGFRAFRSDITDRTTTYGGRQLPVAVARVCRLTQSCEPYPQTNVHPNDRGYRVLGRAFVRVLGL